MVNGRHDVKPEDKLYNFLFWCEGRSILLFIFAVVNVVSMLIAVLLVFVALTIEQPLVGAGIFCFIWYLTIKKYREDTKE